MRKGKGKYYALPNLHEHSFYTAVSSPVRQNGDFGLVDLTIVRIDKWEVDFRDELDGWRTVWVSLATDDLQAVDSVLVDGLEDRRPSISALRGDLGQMKVNVRVLDQL